MTASERYVYLFFRTDLPLAQQIVQSNHATMMMAALRGEEGVPNIVAIGVPHTKSLQKVQLKLRKNKIPHFAWIEPDFNYGLTAIATAPIWGQQRDILKEYRVYKPNECCEHSRIIQMQGSPVRSNEGSNPSPGANAS